MGYDERYDLPVIRGKPDKDSNSASRVLESMLHYEALALDVGCGTCRKLIPIAGACRTYYGIDRNPAMIRKAVTNVTQANVANVHPRLGHAFYLPFDGENLDLVSCMLAPYSLEEFHRVLRPNGHVFMELLGVDDKRDIKSRFGSDKLGWRGILLNTDNATKENNLYRGLSAYFEEIEIRHFRWRTTIPFEGLLVLLSMTPTIRDFHLEADRHVVEGIRKLSTADRVTFEEHRMVVTARKKRRSERA